jgi:DNA-binding NtrC family response regulator
MMALTRSLRARLGPGVRVEGALSAEEAQEAIIGLRREGVGVQVVISDLNLPGMHGDEFLRLLNREDPSIRGIILTGMGDGLEVQALSRDIGLFGSLSKPCDTDKLAALVASALETTAPLA